MFFMRNSFIIFLGFCFLIGCGSDWKAEIESTTSWKAECKKGDFIYNTVEGSGNKTISLSDDEKVCVTVQKKTEEGYLKITIIDDTIIWSSGDPAWAETNHPYGKVEACSSP
jgi:hypothetical protein